MKYRRLAIQTALILGLLFALSACAVLGINSQKSTPSPEPTSSIPNLQVVSPLACQIAEQRMIRVEHAQGNLIAWSPSADIVAYIASTQGSSWDVGDLDILSATAFDTPVRLASNVAGELTWAPDASALAYLGLRRSDDLYTIGLAYPNGSPYKDLFPDEAARTDNYSSQKLILDWTEANQLNVMVSCGVNCFQKMEIDVQSGKSSKVGEPIEKYWSMWASRTNHPAAIPTPFANLPGQLNWSPDDSHIAYIDASGNAWVINADADSLYPLDIGGYGTATEVEWSYEGRYLAVQVDQYLIVFSFKCP